jgi:hypothetical protein
MDDCLIKPINKKILSNALKTHAYGKSQHPTQKPSGESGMEEGGRREGGGKKGKWRGRERGKGGEAVKTHAYGKSQHPTQKPSGESGMEKGRKDLGGKRGIGERREEGASGVFPALLGFSFYGFGNFRN